MLRRICIPVAAAGLALLALTMLGGGDATRPVVMDSGSDAAMAPAPVVVAAPSLQRQRAELAMDPRSMDEVHALRRAAAATGAGSVPELRRVALTAGNAVAVCVAISALSRLHAVAGDRDLVALAADSRQGVRQEIVLALGASGDGRCVPLLRDLALGQDKAVRPLAIQGLGRLGGAAALAALRELAQRGGLSPTDAAFARQALQTANAGGELPMVPQGTRLLPPSAELSSGDRLDESGLPR